MARRSYKDKSRKRKKKKTTQRVGELPLSTRGLLTTGQLTIGFGFAVAALFHPHWVKWGREGTSVSLWSFCATSIYGFRDWFVADVLTPWTFCAAEQLRASRFFPPSLSFFSALTSMHARVQVQHRVAE